MTAAAIGSPSVRTVGRLGSWLSVRHSLRMEAAAALSLYGLYELARGLVGRDTAQADAHAHRLVALERSLHLFVEANMHHVVQTLPGLTSLLGVAYLTLHLAVTAGVLLWLHRRRPEGFPFVRTALLLASGLALVGFLLYPRARSRHPRPARIRHERLRLVRRPARSPRDRLPTDRAAETLLLVVEGEPHGRLVRSDPRADRARRRRHRVDESPGRRGAAGGRRGRHLPGDGEPGQLEVASCNSLPIS
jgi:hypothetical protein